jgi:cytochrome c oxidase subunit I+III
VGPELASGAGYLGHARNGWQETLGVHRTTGEPDQVLILPRPTYLPLAMGVVTLIAVLAMLFKVYAVAMLAAAVFAGTVIWGARHAGLPADHGPLPIGGGLSVPPHPEAADPPPVLAMAFTLLANGTIFACLIFGALYLWLVAANWPPAELVTPGWIMPGVALVGLLAGPLAARAAVGANRRGRVAWPWVAAQGLAGCVALAALVLLILLALPDPRAHAYSAVNFALLGYGCLHVGIALLFLISNAQRLASGYISARRSMDLRLTRMWQDYTATTGVLAVLLVLALPLLVVGR